MKWRLLRDWEEWLLRHIGAAAPGNDSMPAFLRPDAGVKDPALERQLDKLFELEGLEMPDLSVNRRDAGPTIGVQK